MRRLRAPGQHATRVRGTAGWWYALWFAAAVAGFGVTYVFTTVTLAVGDITAKNVDELLPDERPEPAPDPIDGSSGRAVNILVMGSDVRDGENAKIGGSFDGMRNDATVILHLSADRSRLDLVSIPRDAQVEIQDCLLFDGTVRRGTTGDFNVAFANGGVHGDPAEAAACAITTVEHLTGVFIDHYVVVDFTGFIEMVDAVGGVPVCVPEHIVSKDVHLDIQPGLHLMDGRTALQWARLRTAEVGEDVSGSDLQRIERQQTLLNNLFSVVKSKNILTDVGQLTALLRAIANSLYTDEDLADVGALVGLAFSLRSLDLGEITFLTPPWKYTPGFLNVEFLPEAQAVWDALALDQPLPGGTTGTNAPGVTDGDGEGTTTGPTAPSNDVCG